MPGTAIHFGFTDESLALLKRSAAAARHLEPALHKELERGLYEAENHLKRDFFAGFSGDVGREKKFSMLFNRSGSLRREIGHQIDRPLSGLVGAFADQSAKYAAVQLGAGAVTMTPKNAGHLWVPIADNIGAGGLMKMSPREAMAIQTPTGKRALRIFKSKAGNLVAFLPGEVEHDTAGEKMGFNTPLIARDAGRYKKGAKKGKTKGQLLFVLKDRVTVQGSGALNAAVHDVLPQMTARIAATTATILGGGQSNG